MEKKIGIIKQWFVENYGINCYNDNFFINFLHRCHFDEEMCRQKIICYFRNKKLYSEFFQAGNLKDEEFRSFCSSIYSLYMPKLSSNGYRVFVDKVTDDENLFDIFKIIKYYCMQTDVLYCEEGFDNGDVILFDCNNMRLRNLITFIPYFIKSLILLLEMYPIRIKLFVLINTGTFMEKSLNFMKFTILKKFNKVIYVYSGGREFLSKHFDRSILPVDYGGDLPTLNQIRDKWMEKLDQYDDWFSDVNHKIENSSYTSWNIENVFGDYGSFKKLQID